MPTYKHTRQPVSSRLAFRVRATSLYLAERVSHDNLAKFKLGSVEAAARVPMDAPVGRWAMTALKSSTAPVRMGNFVTGTQTVYSLLVTKYPR